MLSTLAFLSTILNFFRPTDPQNINHQQKQTSTNSSAFSSKLHSGAFLDPCIEPVGENTTAVPSHLSPSLSIASSGYYPQTSYLSSASHSYYTTAEGTPNEEPKTSEGN